MACHLSPCRTRASWRADRARRSRRALRTSPIDALIGVAVFGALLAARPVLAQAADATSRAVASWIVLDAPPGSEGRPSLNKAFTGWTVDAWGNFSKRSGSGRPRRVVACALDQSGYVVSQITDEGYLRLRRSGQGVPHQLWDQFHEAQRIRILTRAGNKIISPSPATRPSCGAQTWSFP